MFGFGIPGQGFYAFDIPGAKVKVSHATGLITVLEGEASEEKLDKELKHLVREDWDFRVRKVDKQEYIVAFPDKSSLDTFAKHGCLNHVRGDFWASICRCGPSHHPPLQINFQDRMTPLPSPRNGTHF
jgi:hypothetical protein